MGIIKLTHLPLDKMAAVLADDIFKCIFLNENNVPIISPRCVSIKKLRQRQSGRHFADDISKCIFVNEMWLFWHKFYCNLFLRVH